MAEIDMIPRSYRDGVRVRSTLRRAGAALACVAVLGVGAVGALHWRGAAIARQAAALEAAADQAQATRARGAAVQAASLHLQRRDATLQALRRQGELDAVTRGLEAALSDKVWLTALTLARDVQAATPKDAPAEGVEALDAADGAGQPGWHTAATLDLQGQATDYAAAAAFLDALGRQRGIVGLHLVGSSAGADGQTIDFHAAGYVVRRTPQ